MSVHRGGEGVCLSACWEAIPHDGEPPLGWRTPPWMENPPLDGEPPMGWRTPPGLGRPPLDGEPPLGWRTPPRMENPPGTRQTPPLRETDSSIRSTSGRYASYWNAFLLAKKCDDIQWFTKSEFFRTSQVLSHNPQRDCCKYLLMYLIVPHRNIHWKEQNQLVFGDIHEQSSYVVPTYLSKLLTTPHIIFVVFSHCLMI